MFDILIFDSLIFDIGSTCDIDIMEEPDSVLFVCSVGEIKKKVKEGGVFSYREPKRNLKVIILENQDEIKVDLTTRNIHSSFNLKEKPDICKVDLLKQIKVGFRIKENKDGLKIYSKKIIGSQNISFSIKESLDYMDMSSMVLRFAGKGIAEEELLFLLLLI